LTAAFGLGTLKPCPAVSCSRNGGPTRTSKGHHDPALDPAALGNHLQPTGALPIQLKLLRRNRICMRNGV